MLPDIDEQSWDQYQQQNLGDEIKKKIDSFGLQTMIGEKIAGLQGLITPPPAPAPEPPPAPAAPVEPPEVSQARQEYQAQPEPPPQANAFAAPSFEPPEVTAARQQFSQQPEAAPVPPPEPFAAAPSPDVGPPPSTSPALTPPRFSPAPAPSPMVAPSPPTSGDDWFGQVLGRVHQAGGDVQKFADNFSGAGDAFGGALGAAGAAGANVQQFAQGLTAPPPPPQATAGLLTPGGARPPGASVQGVPGWLTDLITQNAPGDLASDPDFIRTVAAGAKAESGWDPNRVQQGFRMGSGAGARGLFQFDMGGMGAGISEDALLGEQGAAYQASKIVPLYAKAYQSAPAGLSGAEKASWVAAQAERPLGFTDPNSAARRNYAGAYNEIGASPLQQVGNAFSNLGSAAQGAIQQVSQFGDKQLSADEAYAACGPAAAVRFASMYGRNPSLREATDLAASVGWTPDQGMAGLASEKSLMDKLGIATRMIGANIQAMAQEAQTGNPVTISTPGHYFTADGYDPASGAFHVGQSGLDLKGGSEWMTVAQIQARMGQIQGALLADNPQVPQPSTAEQTSNPLSYLGRLKDTVLGRFSPQPDDQQMASVESKPLVNSLTGALTAAWDEQTSNLDRAVRSAFQAGDSANWSDEQKRQAGLVTGYEGAPPEKVLDTLSGNPLERLQKSEQYRRDLIEQTNPLTDVGPSVTVPGMGEVKPIGAATNMALDVATDPLTYALAGPIGGAAEAVAGRLAPGLARSLAKGAIEGGQWGGLQGLETPGADVQQVASNALLGATLPVGATLGLRGAGLVGQGLGRAAEALGKIPDPFAARAAERDLSGLTGDALATRQISNEEARALVGGAWDPSGVVTGRRANPDDYVSDWDHVFRPPEQAEVPNIGDRVRGYRDFLNRQFFDNKIDLKSFDERTYNLSRLAADPAAEMKIQNGLRPAIQAVAGNRDYDALRDLVTARSNVQVADGVASDILRTQADAQVPQLLRDNVAKAEATLKQRQVTLDNYREMNVPENQLGAAQRAVQRAQKSFDLHQGRVDQARQEILDKASREGAEAGASRMFSGDQTRESSLQKLADIEATLRGHDERNGTNRWDTVSQAADQISEFGKILRGRLVESGVLSEEQAAQMEAKYPDWVKTKILEYMGAKEGGQAAGSKIGLNSRDVHAYTQAGTKRAREDPIASMVHYAHTVERQARKNEAFNAFLEADRATGNPQLREVPHDFKPTNTQDTITGFVDGEKKRFVTDNKALAQAFNQSSVTQLPDWMQAWAKTFRNLATTRNPVFLAGNTARDIPEYLLRSSVREGGPQNLPKVMGELIKSYADAFDGIRTGTFEGKATQRYLGGGGGESGVFTSRYGREATSQEVAKRAEEVASELGKKHVLQVRNGDDLRKLMTDLITLKPVEKIGERLELAPRVAAMRLAEKRGLSPEQAIIQGRDVTVDFSQGGNVTKILNQMVPFFNVGFQGPAQVARAFGDNRGAFAATVGSLIGVPTAAAEIWNNSDEQRARDYADVPQYIKDQGIVVMLPGDAPVDSKGERHPSYAFVNLMNWAPFAGLTRQAIDRGMGYAGQQNLKELAGSMSAGFSPFDLDNPANLIQRIAQGVPGLSAAAQIQQNRDFFRNRAVVSQRADERASQFAKDVTPLLQGVVDATGGRDTIRPSAVDFLARDLGAGTAGAAMSAYDLIRGAPQQEGKSGAGEIPIVGGLAGRFVRNQGGELLNQYQDQGLSDETRQALRAAGVNYTPSPLQNEIKKVPLTYDEQVYTQALANQYIDQQIQGLLQTPEWQNANTERRKQLTEIVASRGRTQAENEVLTAMGERERTRRQAGRSS